MAEVLIEQALYGSHDGGGYRFLGRSPGFLEDWLPEAEKLCTGFGDRPAGVACPLAVFARPLGKRHVAVVQAADQGTDDAVRPGAMAFRLLVLTRDDHDGLGGDPFALADRFPPDWRARGHLAVLSVPAVSPPPRTVEQICTVLKRSNGPELLGSAQALLDGSKVVFPRPEPDAALLRDLWLLLPSRTRGELWPASFAFGNALKFDAVVVAHPTPEAYPGYLTEEQAGSYPEGRYELRLQAAAESGDQRDLDRLFDRRTPAETMRLGLILLAGVAVLTVAIGLIGPGQPAKTTAPATKPAPLTLPTLPPSRTLTEPERARVTPLLRQLAIDLKLDPPETVTAEQLVHGIENRVGDAKALPGAPKVARDGPLEQRLRLLLWKYGGKDYAEPGLNAAELAERLRAAVSRAPS